MVVIDCRKRNDFHTLILILILILPLPLTRPRQTLITSAT
jgi:hypothetical protein